MNDKKNKMYLECSCGCSVLKIEYWDANDGFVFLNHYTQSWDSLSGTIWTRLKERLKTLWTIAIGKEYCFYEISLENREQVLEFKKFVSGIDESRIPE